MKFLLYTGCTPKVAEPELRISAKALTEALGWELMELPEFVCCGGSHLQDTDEKESMYINARNLAFADASGRDLVTLCNTCQFVLANCRSKLLKDTELRSTINQELAVDGLEFTGTSRVRHFLYVLLDELGLEGIKSRCIKGLDKLRVASFYGCHNIRPGSLQSDLNTAEDAWKPASLDSIVEALGGTSVAYPMANKCCGFHVSLYKENLSAALSGAVLKQAHERRADLLITPCPLCHTSLDAAQYEAKKAVGLGLGFPLPLPSFLRSFELTPAFIKEDFDLPVLHFEQLIGLAWGIRPRKLGLQHNIVSWKKSPALAAYIKKKV